MVSAMADVVCLLLMLVPLAAGLECGPDQYPLGRRCCSMCPENAHQTAACTADSDTICECGAGHWLDRTGEGDPAAAGAGPGACRPCRLCRPGHGASRPCSPHHNTVCGACPAGFFSHKTEQQDSARECVRCTVCRSDQVNIQNCTADQDTVCMDKSFNVLSEGGAGSELSLSSGTAADPWPAEQVSSDIPIYCGILGTVIIVLLLYVGVRHWKLRAAPQKSSPASAPSAVVVTRPASSLDPSSGCPQIEPLVSVPLKKRLTEMPVNERREIETQLCNHPTNNWTALADVLGYSKQHVRQVQEQAAERKSNPARLLISDWAKRSDATVASFTHALVMIGRRDLVGLVTPKPVRLTVANVDNFV